MKAKKAGAGRPAKEEQETKRQHLIKAARAELLRTGGTEFRLNQVLKAAGGSKTTLYSYFGGREGLLEAVLRETVEEFLPKADTVISQDPEIVLQEFAKATYRMVLRPETFALYRMAILESKSTPKLAKIFYKTGPAVARSALGDLLLKWNAEKESRFVIPPSPLIFSMAYCSKSR